MGKKFDIQVAYEESLTRVAELEESLVEVSKELEELREGEELIAPTSIDHAESMLRIAYFYIALVKT